MATEPQGEVKFGLGQITNRTPDFAKWAFRIILYLAATANIIIGVVTEIPEETRLLIGKYSIYAVTLVHSFSKLFGISPEGPSYFKGKS